MDLSQKSNKAELDLIAAEDIAKKLPMRVRHMSGNMKGEICEFNASESYPVDWEISGRTWSSVEKKFFKTVCKDKLKQYGVVDEDDNS